MAAHHPYDAFESPYSSAATGNNRIDSDSIRYNIECRNKDN